MSAFRFHRAARDSFLDVLRETTARDCNSPDEDGLTPTLWAAFQGNVDALRLLVGRGGDPNKCDHYGNTALHLASAEGHLVCVSFLISFGVNLWALDNDLQTAKDRAAMAERDEILRLLDNAMAEQSAKNKKLVASLKEKAVSKAEKRIKASERLHKEAVRRAREDDRRLHKERLKMLEATDAQNGRKDQTVKFSDIVNTGTATKKTLRGVHKKILKKKDNDTLPSSDFKVAEQVVDGKRSTRSISGLRRDNEVLYVTKFGAGKPQVQDIFQRKRDLLRTASESDVLSTPSLFDRPGFGSIAFRQSMSGTLASLPSQLQFDLKNIKDGVSDSESSGTTEDESAEPMIAFLAMHGLSDYIPRFLSEQIDLEALMLLTDDDLLNIIQPLGPRRKLIRAIQERKNAIEDPGEVVDSHL